MTGWLSGVVIVVLAALGAPLFVCLGLAAAACIVQAGHSSPAILAQQIYTITENDALLAIPFFVLASSLMTAGTGARRIVEFIASLVEWLPGGLGLATVVSCVFFAAMCGLSPAAVAAVGTIMLPGLLAAGYPERFSLGLVTSAGSLGILIPPSLVVIVLGVVVSSSVQDYNQSLSNAALKSPVQSVAGNALEKMDTSDTAIPAWATGAAVAEKQAKPAGPKPVPVTFKNLFLAGLLPAALIAALFCAYSILAGAGRGVRPGFSGAAAFEKFRAALPALALPVIVTAGIFSGKLTVVQAAALAAVYAAVLEIIIHRSLKLQELTGVFREAGAVTGMILLVLSVTFALNWFLTSEGITAKVAEFITAEFHSRVLFLLSVNLLFLVMGCLMDILSAVFITVPLLLPAAMAMGVDPVHFSVMFIVNFEIGYLTPPVGINLFTASAVFRKDLMHVSRAVLPYLALLLLALAAVTYIPGLSLWLVHAAGG